MLKPNVSREEKVRNKASLTLRSHVEFFDVIFDAFFFKQAHFCEEKWTSLHMKQLSMQKLKTAYAVLFHTKHMAWVLVAKKFACP